MASVPVDRIASMRGHSGCDVSLCEANGIKFVRKVSSDIQYNARLKAQADKQSALADIIRVPQVYNSGEIGDLFYFDMEYIAGQNFSNLCLSFPLGKIHESANSIADAIIKLSTLAAAPHSVAWSLRLSRFQQMVASARLGKEQTTLQRAVRILESVPEQAITPTWCHGDLTLENIIFTPDRIIFIDVLDSDVSSFLIDLAKLLFDLEFGWSARNIMDRHELNIVYICNSYVKDIVQTKINETLPLDMGVMESLKIFNAIRILPYTNEGPLRENLLSYIAKKSEGAYGNP